MPLYRTVLTVEVLTTEPVVDTDLDSINYLITEGHGSGMVTISEQGTLSTLEMAKALQDQGSDPEFLLDDEHEIIAGTAAETREIDLATALELLASGQIVDADEQPDHGRRYLLVH